MPSYWSLNSLNNSFAGALIIVTFKKLAPGDEMLRIHPSPALILLS